MRIIFEKTKGSDAIEDSARKWYSITPSKRLWKYIPWLPKFTALLTEIRKTRKLISEISMPTYVFHATHDSLVSNSSVKFFTDNKNINLTLLTNSYHQYFTEEDYSIIIDKFSSLIKPLDTQATHSDIG